MVEDDFEGEYEYAQRPNKSQLKREAEALRDLAGHLVALPESLWSKFGLSDTLLDELRHLKSITQHGAKKRQLKRVAKLLRAEDVAEAESVVVRVQSQHAELQAAFHQVERWRDRLLSDDKHALTEFLRNYPGADAQAIRQLIRNAKREAEQGKGAKSSKLLFKLLRDIMD